MKITNNDLATLASAVKELSEKEMPFKTALKVSKNLKLLNEKMIELATDEKELIEKYAEVGEDGQAVKPDGTFTIPPKCFDQYLKERKELMEFEVEISGIYMITVAEIESISIKPTVLSGLERIIEEND